MKTESENRLSVLILVVVYKQLLSESDTILSLLRSQEVLHPNDTVLIWDNSPDAQSMDFVETALKIGHGNWTYQHHPENIPLPKVYNNVVAHARNEELIIFLDQDSQFDQEYIKEVTESALTYPGINLFAPLVYARNRLVSPGHFQYFKGRYWSKPKKGLTCAKGNIALMSGLAVRTSYLRSFGGFDERLRLYGVDTNLLLRYAKSNKQFFVLGALFNHDLSDFNKEPHDVKLKRFEDFDHASRINAELFSLPVQILTAFFLWYRRLGLKACRS